MPYHEPDETDPMTLTGVELEVDDADAVQDMALCFVEEYVRLGQSEEAIFEIFASGVFAGPSLAYRQLGPDTIREIVREQCQLRGPGARRIGVDQLPGGNLSLPVLDS